MKFPSKHATCVLTALLGIAVGWAGVAYGQEIGAPIASLHATGVDPSAALLLDLVGKGGPPAVLGLLGWLVGRGGLPVRVSLAEEDREILRDLRDQATAPRPRPPRSKEPS